MSLVRNITRMAQKTAAVARKKEEEERRKRGKQSDASGSAQRSAQRPQAKTTTELKRAAAGSAAINVKPPMPTGTKPAQTGIVGSAARRNAAKSAARSAQTGAKSAPAAQTIKPLDMQNPENNVQVNTLIQTGQTFGSAGGSAVPRASNRDVTWGALAGMKKAGTIAQPAATPAPQGMQPAATSGTASLNRAHILSPEEAARINNRHAKANPQPAPTMNPKDDTARQAELAGMQDYLTGTEFYKTTHSQLTAQRAEYERLLKDVDAQLMATDPYAQYEIGRKEGADAETDSFADKRNRKYAPVDSYAGHIPAPGEVAAEAALRAQRISLMTQRRQLQLARDFAGDRLNNLLDETRVRAIAAGEIPGTLFTEDKLRYNIDQKSDEDASGAARFFDQLGATGMSTFVQTIASTPRDISASYVTAAAALGGYDSVSDWAADHPDQYGIYLTAFSPTQDLSDYSGSFDSEGWNKFQQLEHTAAESAKQMLGSMLLGGAAQAGGLSGTLARGAQYIGSALPEASGAARDAVLAGADSGQAGEAMLLTGLANGFLEQGGMDYIWSKAARFGRLRPGALKKGMAALKSSKFGGFKSAAKDILQSFLSEGAEEMAEDIVSGTVAKVVYDQDRAWLGEGGVIDPEVLKADGLLGGGMGAMFTVLGGLAMPGKYRAHSLASDIMARIDEGHPPTPGELYELSTQLNADVRKTEHTALDAEAHRDIWLQNGVDAPETLEAWRAAAYEAEGLGNEYSVARWAVEDMVARASAGEFDPATPEGAKEYNAIMQRHDAARDEYDTAYQLSLDKKAAYYADEDALAEQVEGKADMAKARARELEEALREALNKDRILSNLSDDVQAALESANEAIINREGIAGELESAHMAEVQAASPAEQLEARAQRKELETALDAATAEADAAKAELQRAAMAQADFDARMTAGRAANAEAGRHDSRYDDMTDAELQAEQERLMAIEQDVAGRTDEARGTARTALRKAQEDLARRRAALDAELALRGEVYGEREYQTRAMREEAERYREADAAYEQSGMAQDAALRDYAPNGGASLSEVSRALYRAAQDNPLYAGHEYHASDYDALAQIAFDDGGSHTAQEWLKIYGFKRDGTSQSSSNLDRFIHNYYRSLLNANDNLTVEQAKSAEIPSEKILEFLTNEQMTDAIHMSERRQFYEKLYAHGDVNVLSVDKPTIDTRTSFASARKLIAIESRNADTQTDISINSRGYSEILHDIVNKNSPEMREVSLAALQNFGPLMENAVYVGSHADYGGDAHVKAVHYFVSPFEYGDVVYRAIYSVHETADGRSEFSNKLYLQRVGAIKTKIKADGSGGQLTSQGSNAGITYTIHPSDTISIPANGETVNTISMDELLDGYNLSDKKLWPLARMEDGDSLGINSGGNYAEPPSDNAGSTSETIAIDAPAAHDVTPSAPEVNAPPIYRNGSPLFAGMDENELNGEIAREGRLTQDPDPAISQPALKRLEALRSERDTRANTQAQDARKARRDAARADRLSEIDEMIASIPEAPDGELSRHRNYLRRQINQLTTAQEGADRATAKAYADEIQRMRESLAEIETEERGRADLRRVDMERMEKEMAGDPARAEVEGEARDVDILEKQRIRLNQQTGRAAVEKLKAEHRARGREWRTTDTISLEEAVRIFDDAAGMTAEGEGEAPMGGAEALLKENREALARWEQRSAALDSAIADMERERDMLRRRDHGTEGAYTPEQVLDGMRENRLNTSIAQAKALKVRAKRSIAYLQAHAGEGILDAVKGGRLPEQLMERVMGSVDRLKIPKSGLLGMNANTAARVFDDLFGDEAPVMRALYIDPVAGHVAGMQRYIDELRGRIAALKLDGRESELAQRFGEGLLTPDELVAEIDAGHARRGTKLKDGRGEWTGDTSLKTAAGDLKALDYEGFGDKADEVRRISHAADVFAGIYKELFGKINDARVRNGYKPMGKLENYFPHFQEETGGIIRRMANRMGFGGGKYALPTEIDGLTAGFSPGKNYNKHGEHRRGQRTGYDALKGFEDYIESAAKEIFLTDDIQRLRQLERAVRGGEEAGVLTTRQTADRANGDFGSFAKWLHEYTNLLAGKKSGILDRGIEEMGGRVYYQAVDILRKKRGAAAIAGNVASAMTNIAPVVQVTGEHPVAAVKGLVGAVNALIHGDSEYNMPKSDFLARRFGSDQLGVGLLARTANWMSKPFQIFDIAAANIVVRTNYYAGLDAGMDPDSAMMCADDKAARLMADRSLGQMPNIYSSRTFMATLGQFQLEVANTLKWGGKDMIRTYGKAGGAARMGLSMILFALANMGWEQLTGRELFIDPLGSIKDGIDAGKEAAEEEGPWQGTWEGVKTAATGIGQGLPYIGGLFGGGRIGTNLLGNAWDAGQTILDAVQAGNDGDAWDAAFWAMTNYVTYGGQFKKSYQGAGALMQNGVYDSQGRLMYPVDASDPWTRIQATVFGKSATYYARQYWDEGRAPLSTANTSTYEKLCQQGVNPTEAYEEVYAYQQAVKLNSAIKEKTQAGDTEGAARLRTQRDEMLKGVNYDMLIPDDMAGHMGGSTLEMLESAWREDMDSAFLPKAVRYNGQFSKGGVSYQFTDESMGTLQGVAQQELDRRMQGYKDAWSGMSAEERAAALKTCTGGKDPEGNQVWKSSVWVYAKEYGFEHGLEYMTTADYKAMHKDDADEQYTNPNPGLTNPIADVVRVLSGFAQTGEEAEAQTGNETTGTAPGDMPVGDILPEVKTYTGGDTHGGTGKSGGGSGRRGGSRRGSGGSSGGGASISLTVGTPEATVTIPWHRTRLYESFGEGYNPFPLTGSFEWGGRAYNLEGEEMTQYTGLYDAYMDIYLRERQAEWDSADNARREEIYREIDERAKEAAREQFAGMY